MAEQYVMALDAGTGAGRCVLMSLDGQRHFSTYQEWSYTAGPDGGTTFDPETFWGILAGAARRGLEQAGLRPEQVAAISSTSQREGCVFLDEAGREIYAGPNLDLRAWEQGRFLMRAFGPEIYRRTGHYPNGIFMPARLLWFKEHRPEAYNRIAHVLMINDWVLYRLCGEYACEPSNASETCLYDLDRQAWGDDLIEALDLPRHIFPPVLACGTPLGRLSPAAAAALGLKPGVPVIMGGADTQCGLVGCGAIEPTDVAAVSGTTTPVQMVTAKPIWDEAERLWAGSHVIADRYVLESNAGSSGITYRWYRDMFCQLEVQQATKSQVSAYDLMNAQAALAPAGAGGIQSYVGVLKMNAKNLVAPKSVINFGRRTFGLSADAQKPLLTRAVLESLAYAVKANLDQIVEVSGVAPARLHVCGGLAHCDLYLNILAAVTGLPLQAPTWTEGSATGAGICAGVGVGAFSTFQQGVAALVRNCERLPDEQWAAAYAPLYASWIEVYHDLMQVEL